MGSFASPALGPKSLQKTGVIKFDPISGITSLDMHVTGYDLVSFGVESVTQLVGKLEAGPVIRWVRAFFILYYKITLFLIVTELCGLTSDLVSWLGR